MNTKTLTVLSATAAVAVLAGCASTAPHRIEAGGATAVTTMGVNVADFKDAASKMVESMLVSGALDKQFNHKPIIGVSEIRNDTPERFDTDQIAFKITTDLTKAQKVQVVTTWGKNAVDTGAKSVQAEKSYGQDGKSVHTLPDYTLAGKILFTSARDGRLREGNYTFQLYLTDTSTGLAIWQDERTIAKQTTRPSVSF